MEGGGGGEDKDIVEGWTPALVVGRARAAKNGRDNLSREPGNFAARKVQVCECCEFEKMEEKKEVIKADSPQDANTF